MTEEPLDLDPGVRSNRRLTALTGLALLVPLLAAFLSGLALDSLWRVHYFAGFVLVPLVSLKLATTGYRMASYYLGSPRYRRAGPPAPGLRLLAPVLVASTVVVLVSGIAMWLAGGARTQPWSTLHNGSAVLLVVTGGIHLLAHLRRATGEAAAELARRSRPPMPPPARRRAALAGALAVGAVLAAATIAPSHAPVRGHRDGFDRFGQVGAPPRG